MAYTKDYEYSHSTARGETTVEETTASVYRNMYLWMTAGLSITALTAFVVMDRISHSQPFAETFLSGGMMIFLAIVSFVLVFVLSGMINRLSFVTATLLFALYSVIMGAWMAPVLLVYTEASVFKVFLITAGTFGGMAVYGHVTKSDLTTVGRIAGMALWGVILASIVNFFMHSAMMDYVISYVAIAIFCGLTMYDVQKFKELIFSFGSEANDNVRKIALIGALSLYLDFLNLFLHLLRILGSRRD